MEFTIKEILEMKDVLQKVIYAEVPIKTAFRISRFVKSIQIELESFEKIRMKLLQKYGEKEENGQQISIKDPEKQKLFSDEIQKVLAENIDIDFLPVKIEELGNDIKISAVELLRLEKIIIFPEEKKKAKKTEKIKKIEEIKEKKD